jgi:hypothetical protein
MNLKEQIKHLLHEKNYAGLTCLSASRKRILTVLISLTYDKKTSISWRAIEAIGLFTGELARSDQEAVRHTAERLLWMIRDESGGIGWSAPEILGEIVKNNPELCSDIAPVIVSFHEEPPLCAGVLWAAGRIGRLNKEMVDYALPIISGYLHSSDNAVRGYAAWALGEMGTSEALKELEALDDDRALIPFYEEGELKEKSISEIATEAVKKLHHMQEVD